MTLKELDNYINKKIFESEDFLIFSYYELRVKNNLKNDEVDRFLELAKTKLENSNYRIYRTGEKYIYAGSTGTVEDNILMVAVKR